MKLKNKKTGEMGIINYFDNQSIVIYPIDENWNAKGDKKYVYHSLAELNEEWEDYEEPKEYWYIDPMVCGIYCTSVKKDKDLYEFNKQIGNCFETKEEAEKAVEKLKAWKRLKDKGFSFNDWDWKYQNIGYNLDCTAISEEDVIEAEKDLDLLFGGEQ